MTTNRFQITSINDRNCDKISSKPSEIIPLINIESDIPIPPSLPIPFASVNETNKPSNRLFNNVLHRLKTSSSTTDITSRIHSSSLPVIQSNSTANLTARRCLEGDDTYQATIHSSTSDASSFRVTNKFLHELRLKRREIHDKAKNLPIDQRIALNRCRTNRDVLRAQDIFAVHFEFDDDDDDDDLKTNIFNEDAQEKIRNKIFHELDRQRTKRYHKQHRQLIFGRVLLLLIIALLTFMGITLIYVTMNLYNRAKSFATELIDNEFLPIIYDNATNI